MCVFGFFLLQRAFSNVHATHAVAQPSLMDLSWAKHEAGPDRRCVSHPANPGCFHQTHKSLLVSLTAAMFPPAVNTVDAATLICASLCPLTPPLPMAPPSIEAQCWSCDRLFLRSCAEGRGKGEKTKLKVLHAPPPPINTSISSPPLTLQ